MLLIKMSNSCGHNHPGNASFTNASKFQSEWVPTLKSPMFSLDPTKQARVMIARSWCNQYQTLQWPFQVLVWSAFQKANVEWFQNRGRFCLVVQQVQNHPLGHIFTKPLQLKANPHGGVHKWGTPVIIHFDGISIVNQPFGGTPIYGNPHIKLTEINLFTWDSPLGLDNPWARQRPRHRDWWPASVAGPEFAMGRNVKWSTEGAVAATNSLANSCHLDDYII